MFYSATQEAQPLHTRKQKNMQIPLGMNVKNKNEC